MVEMVVLGELMELQLLVEQEVVVQGDTLAMVVLVLLEELRLFKMVVLDLVVVVVEEGLALLFHQMKLLILVVGLVFFLVDLVDLEEQVVHHLYLHVLGHQVLEEIEELLQHLVQDL